METKTQQNITTQPDRFGLAWQSSTDAWAVCAQYDGFWLTFSPNRKTIWRFWQWQMSESAALPENQVNVYQLFSLPARQAWRQADRLAKKANRTISLEDMFLALLKQRSVAQLFVKLKINPREAFALLENYAKISPPATNNLIKQLPFVAFALAANLRHDKIGSLMLLGALVELAPQSSMVAAIFSNIGLDAQKWWLVTAWVLHVPLRLPQEGINEDLAYCCWQAQNLEQMFGCYFEFPAVETALKAAAAKNAATLRQHALKLLVKAAGLAKQKKRKTITERLVLQAAA
ncbi:MAG: hypothetical protein KGJ93_00595 [Patescibacteria group bacterium]|nr:hypothetical protein [Patescibacteria group bacterium]